MIVCIPSVSSAQISGAGGLLAANNLSDLANKQTAVDNLTNDAAVLHVKLASTATEGFQIYNTADQTTNYERLEAKWSGNVAYVEAASGGTGTRRSIAIRSGDGIGSGNNAGISILFNSSPYVQIFGSGQGTNQANATTLQIGAGGASYGATSGTTIICSIVPTYNQASGTAANTEFLVNTVVTAVGSGTQKFADFQINGTSWYSFGRGNTATTSGFNSSNTVEPCVTFAPIINQSGTAGYTGLKVNVTETGTGSGAKLLLDLQVGAASKFKVDNSGNVTATGGVSTDNVSSSGTGGIQSSNASGGVGYKTGAGGTVTQATSKVTAFTLSKVVGTITFAADALAADTTTAGATWTNTAIAATDIILWNHISGGTLGAYTFSFACGAGSATVKIRNLTPGSLSEAPVIAFAVLKGVTA